eukprot:gene4698-20990_t
MRAVHSPSLPYLDVCDWGISQINWKPVRLKADPSDLRGYGLVLSKLAVVDLVKACFILPVKAFNQFEQKSIGSGFLCQLSGVVSAFTYLHSAILLSAIAVVRYFKIVRPIQYSKISSRGRVMFFSIILFLTSLLVSCLPVFGVGVYHYSGYHGVCFASWSDINIPYRIVFYFVTIGLCYSVLFVCYGRIFCILRRHRRVVVFNLTSLQLKPVRKSTEENGEPNDTNSISLVHRRRFEEKRINEGGKEITTADNDIESHPVRQKANQQSSGMQTMKKFQNDVRVTKMMFTVVVVYSICWLPAFFVTFLSLSKVVVVSPSVFYLIVTLVELKVCLNPLIYGIWNYQFRKALKAIFLKEFNEVSFGKGKVEPAHKNSQQTENVLKKGENDDAL